MKSSAACAQAAFDAHVALFKVLAPGTLLVVGNQTATAVLVELVEGEWRSHHRKDMYGTSRCVYNDFCKGTPLMFVSRVNNTELPYVVVLAEEKLWRVFCHYLVVADEFAISNHLSRGNK